MTVVLSGPAGNTTGVGARVVVVTKAQRELVQEVYAGAGYLSQTSATLFFGIEPTEVETIHVHWPDGKTSTVTSGFKSRTVIEWGNPS